MKLKRRNISWSIEIDELAESLARRRGCRRGVSELLERLVLAEDSKKRGVAHLFAPKTITSRSHPMKPL